MQKDAYDMFMYRHITALYSRMHTVIFFLYLPPHPY